MERTVRGLVEQFSRRRCIVIVRDVLFRRTICGSRVVFSCRLILFVITCIPTSRDAPRDETNYWYFELTPSAIRRNSDDVIVNFRVAGVWTV